MVIRKMILFDWWKKFYGEGGELNTDKFEKLYKSEPVPEPERTYLSIGPTSKGRVSLRIYYNEVTMDGAGLDSLIQTLEASKMWLTPSLDKSGKQPEDGCQVEEQPV